MYMLYIAPIGWYRVVQGNGLILRIVVKVHGIKAYNMVY